jgi:hypothetical protein
MCEVTWLDHRPSRYEQADALLKRLVRSGEHEVAAIRIGGWGDLDEPGALAHEECREVEVTYPGSASQVAARCSIVHAPNVPMARARVEPGLGGV